MLTSYLSMLLIHISQIYAMFLTSLVGTEGVNDIWRGVKNRRGAGIDECFALLHFQVSSPCHVDVPEFQALPGWARVLFLGCVNSDSLLPWDASSRNLWSTFSPALYRQSLKGRSQVW